LSFRRGVVAHRAAELQLHLHVGHPVAQVLGRWQSPRQTACACSCTPP
jgi:hypothetical protein